MLYIYLSSILIITKFIEEGRLITFKRFLVKNAVKLLIYR